MEISQKEYGKSSHKYLRVVFKYLVYNQEVGRYFVMGAVQRMAP